MGERALAHNTELRQSDELFDWLGPGVYFWEGDPVRAMEWAEDRVKRSRYKEAFVVGAVIDLGNCLDLLLRENQAFLKAGYSNLIGKAKGSGDPMPENSGGRDKLRRNLDCAVIRRVHDIIAERAGNSGLPEDERPEPFDTVRGLFTEGHPVYPGAGFHELTHTQIAVRTSRSIKGLFRPRDLGSMPSAESKELSVVTLPAGVSEARFVTVGGLKIRL